MGETLRPAAGRADRRLDLPGIFGVLTCCALWGGNAVAVKFAVPAYPPFACAALRFLIGLPLLVLACRLLRKPMAVPRRDWWLLGVHALFLVAQIGTFNWGTSQSLAGRASVFINVHPLVIAPLSWALLGERIGARGVAGLTSAAAGVVLLFSTSMTATGSYWGDAVVLLSGVIFGVQTIAQKFTFPRIGPVTLHLWQSTLAVPLFLAYSLAVEGLGSIQPNPAANWGVLYQGLAVTGLCFTLWLVLLGRYSAGRLAAVAFATPLFGVGLGTLLRGEPLSPPLVGAGLLVGLGIYLVASDRAAPATQDLALLPSEDAP